MHWLPRGVVEPPSLEIFKGCLDEILCLCHAFTGKLDQMAHCGPHQPDPFCNSVNSEWKIYCIPSGTREETYNLLLPKPSFSVLHGLTMFMLLLSQKCQAHWEFVKPHHLDACDYTGNSAHPASRQHNSRHRIQLRSQLASCYWYWHLHWLDLMISEVFSNLVDSVILQVKLKASTLAFKSCHWAHVNVCVRIWRAPLGMSDVACPLRAPPACSWVLMVLFLSGTAPESAQLPPCPDSLHS